MHILNLLVCCADIVGMCKAVPLSIEVVYSAPTIHVHTQTHVCSCLLGKDKPKPSFSPGSTLTAGASGPTSRVVPVLDSLLACIQLPDNNEKRLSPTTIKYNAVVIHQQSV